MQLLQKPEVYISIIQFRNFFLFQKKCITNLIPSGFQEGRHKPALEPYDHKSMLRLQSWKPPILACQDLFEGVTFGYSRESLLGSYLNVKQILYNWGTSEFRGFLVLLNTNTSMNIT